MERFRKTARFAGPALIVLAFVLGYLGFRFGFEGGRRGFFAFVGAIAGAVALIDAGVFLWAVGRGGRVARAAYSAGGWGVVLIGLILLFFVGVSESDSVPRYLTFPGIIAVLLIGGGLLGKASTYRRPPEG